MTEIMTMMMIWLVILILAVIVEVATMGLTTIWFAGGALVAIVATLLHAPIAIQVILFFIVSLLLLFFTRPVAVRYFNRDRVKTNVESMVGRQAIVISEVNNLQGTGQVTVGGNQWSARSMDNSVVIPAGAVVNVVAINGVKLIVKTDERMKGLNPAPPSVPEPMSVSQMEELEEKQSE
ncbi:MAG: NfeD family protein [Muribaculaceae bacterium]|nr:NfeD family protein [Muribaculaceae bacterium]